MSPQQIDLLFGYVQERCLWQFHSRSWDRQKTSTASSPRRPTCCTASTPKNHAPMDRMFYADAKTMVDDFKERFPWILDLEPTKVTELMAGLKSG